MPPDAYLLFFHKSGYLTGIVFHMCYLLLSVLFVDKIGLEPISHGLSLGRISPVELLIHSCKVIP